MHTLLHVTMLADVDMCACELLGCVPTLAAARNALTPLHLAMLNGARSSLDMLQAASAMLAGHVQHGHAGAPPARAWRAMSAGT